MPSATAFLDEPQTPSASAFLEEEPSSSPTPAAVAEGGEEDGFLAKINAVLGRAREAQPEWLKYEPEWLKAPAEAGRELLGGMIPRSPREYLAQIYPPAAAAELGASLAQGDVSGIPFVGRVPEIMEAEETPAGSKERYLAAMKTLMDVGLLAGAGAKPRIPLRAEPLAMPELPPSPTLGPGTIAQDVSKALERRFTLQPTPPEPRPQLAPAPSLEQILGGIREPLPFNPEAGPVTRPDFRMPARSETASFGDTIRNILQGRAPAPQPPVAGVEVPVRQGEFAKPGYTAVETPTTPGAAAQPAPMTAMFSAKGATDALYQKAFDALRTGQTTISGVRDPILARHKAAFDRGEITSWQDLKVAEEGKGVGGITPEAAARAAAPEVVIPEADRPYAGGLVPQAFSEQPHVSAIANRFTAERAAKGELGEIQPGGTISTNDLVVQGMKMTPEQVNESVSRIMQGGDITTRDASAIRGEEARLSQRSNEASRTAQGNPSVDAQLAADNAFKDLTDFHNGPIAALKRNWHLQGKAMQGEIPVDLSTLNGLREAWLKDTGRPPPPHAEAMLRKTADRVAKSVAEEQAAMQRAGEAIEKATRGRKLPTYDEVRNNIAERMKVEPCIV